MVPEVRFVLPDGRTVSAAPGAVIGRARAADLQIDDGRVSEMHAYVSLRATQLVLMSLRGRLRCDEVDTSRVDLRAGQRIELAPQIVLEVASVTQPLRVLAIEAEGLPRQVLLGVTSLLARPTPHLVAGYHADAAALVWSDGVAWRVRVAGEEVRPLHVGDQLQLDGARFLAVEVPVARAEIKETTPATGIGGSGQRLRLITRFESVQIWREGATEPCVLRGISARLVSELLAVGVAVRWDVLAKELWGDDIKSDVLRHRLDVTLLKVRRLLVEGNVRRDLVVSHRTGWIELNLHPGDIADDRA